MLRFRYTSLGSKEGYRHFVLGRNFKFKNDNTNSYSCHQTGDFLLLIRYILKIIHKVKFPKIIRMFHFLKLIISLTLIGQVPYGGYVLL